MIHWIEPRVLYPELKPVAEKLCKYLVKSEKSKQDEIKLEIVKFLG